MPHPALIGRTPLMQERDRLHREAAAYQKLCDRADSLGVPTSLDDRRSPRTVAGLAAAVRDAEAA